MHKGAQCRDEAFPGGIVNGASWYTFPGITKQPLFPISLNIFIPAGGMSDYNYAFHGCYEITLEISCCKYPPPNQLLSFWQENKHALLAYVTEAHRGVTGVVLDEETLIPLPGASLKISGRDMVFKTSNNGEFWRLLLPGRYTLEVNADGYHTKEVEFDVKTYSTFPKLTSLKILLVNETKPAPTKTTTTTTTTAVTPSKIAKTAAAIIKKTFPAVDAPVYYKQVSVIANASSCGVFYVYPIWSVAVMLLAFLQ